jgi:hypothetical protein
MMRPSPIVEVPLLMATGRLCPSISIKHHYFRLPLAVAAVALVAAVAKVVVALVLAAPQVGEL